MAGKYVHPKFGAESFSCPHCGALAHQTWYKAVAELVERNKLQLVDIGNIPNLLSKFKDDPQQLRFLSRLLDRSRQSIPAIIGSSEYHQARAMSDLHFSKCYSCDEIAIWRRDRLEYPSSDPALQASDDLPSDVKADFVEASQIVRLSPRGAAALLRLAIQKLCKHLGEPGDNINNDIAALVQKGLRTDVQRALDIVRVVGNEAVHPGQIDLNDNAETALKLFSLVNLIAQVMITEPKQIEALYGTLPPDKLAQIEKRDTPKLTGPKAS